MSILVRFTPTTATVQQYDETIRLLDQGGDWPPDGLEYHVCFSGSGDNIRVSEIWESPEKFQAFGERLMPVLAQVGIEAGEPEIVEVHNVINP